MENLVISKKESSMKYIFFFTLFIFKKLYLLITLAIHFCILTVINIIIFLWDFSVERCIPFQYTLWRWFLMVPLPCRSYATFLDYLNNKNRLVNKSFEKNESVVNSSFENKYAQ